MTRGAIIALRWKVNNYLLEIIPIIYPADHILLPSEIPRATPELRYTMVIGMLQIVDSSQFNTLH